jgi:branched-chain amino acid transport system ATP-binding protein
MSAARSVEAAKVLTLDRVVVAFSGLRALDDVSMRLGEHPVTAIIGPNGAGKTTVLNVATGFIRPTSGRVSLGDKNLGRTRTHRLPRMGLIRTWQGARLFKSLSVEDNLLVAARRGRASTEEALELLELTDVRRRAIGSLSLGDRLRVVFARALVAEPRIVMLDEPFAGLERGAKLETSTLIRRLALETNLRAVLVEHDVPTVMAAADSVIVMQAGQLLTQGTPDEVIRDERVIECYFGEGLGQW